MRKLTMKAHAILLFALRVSVVSGTLTVVGKRDYSWMNFVKNSMLCVSEDDDGALIWNSNLNWHYSSYQFSDRAGDADFYDLKAHERGQIDCTLSAYGGCTQTWNTTGWVVSNSKETPMGPVFDQRWEGFREYENFETLTKPRFIDKLWESGVFVISVRASSDAHMLLCDWGGPEETFCYWIIIGGWNNTESVIRKCRNGVPKAGIRPDEMACAKQRASYAHSALSSTEWRTFVLTWNETTRNISVYDTEKLLLTYVDDEEPPGNPHNLFLNSHMPMLYRFHVYDFLHTADSRAALTSPVLHLRSTNLCIQMIVGLCSGCRLRIELINVFDESYVESLETIKGSTSVHGLATWRHVRINKTITSDFGTVAKVKLVPELEQDTRNPLWAVANVRLCPPVDSVRYGLMEGKGDHANGYYYWPNVTCQKLSYNENVVVDSTADATTSSEIDHSYCPEGYVGPFCSISCQTFFPDSASCKEIVVCDRTGCRCPPGFIGKNCHSMCGARRYGYDCKETCGWCNLNNCNLATGVCMSGCDNSKRYNIPPFCKKGIDALPPPNIDFINETIVRVVLPIAEEYTLVPFSYRFVIQKQEESDIRYIGNTSRLFKNTTSLIGYTDDLEPGISYRISCALYIDTNPSIYYREGAWRNFTTRCTSTKEFGIERTSKSLTLTKDQRQEPPYSCPTKWYDFRFTNSETGALVSNGTLTKLPYEFANLKPYTFYKVEITKGTAILFSLKVRTLDGVPGRVRNIKKALTSNNEVTLQWDPPVHRNGVIVKYEIVLEIQTYIGCEDLGRPSPRNFVSSSTTSTSFTFSNLVPYARYVAKIAACTSHLGPTESTQFTTHQSETPTAMYSNLRLKDYTLMWDDPEDCSTISGRILTRLKVLGVSERVANFSITKQTVKYSIDLRDILRGAETYEARVFVIRNYGKEENEFRSQKLLFTTPPKAPPPVRNLEVFEIDSAADVVYVRWQEPEPPIEGELEHYTMKACSYYSCPIMTRIPATGYCKLWKNYVCASIQTASWSLREIKVSATNVNCSTDGKESSARIIGDEVSPEAPEVFTIEPLNNGIVNVTWSHPWRSGGHLETFSLAVKMISTSLKTLPQMSQWGNIYQHLVEDYRPVYNERLDLLPSSTYSITVYAITNTHVTGQKRVQKVQTPFSIAFAKELTSDMHTDSSIQLHIPDVLNDTRNSVMSVVVQGPEPCEHSVQLSSHVCEKIAVTCSSAWRAASFPTDEFAGKTFMVGDNKLYHGASNCPLKPYETYVIVVIVQTEEGSMDEQSMLVKTTSIRIGDVPGGNDEAWLISIAIVLVVAIVAFYFCRKKRRSLEKIVLQEEMALAQNTENLEVHSILLNSKQVSTPTPAGNECALRPTPPHVDNAIANHVNQREEPILIKVKDFEDYVKRAIDSGLLDRQFETLPRGQTKPWEYGILPENKPKNRYGNLIAYDENRVILQKHPDDPHSDYINATYIRGYKKEKCYIATQGPKVNTVIDFWRMIWQEEVLIVCMLSNLIEGGKTKCEQYWPDIGRKKKYGDVVVSNTKHTVFADFTFRTLHLTREDETRKIEHLHYTAWPDHGVPLSTHSVVTYLKKLLATSPGNGPVVVHCSAGVGRTGTIILCDICLRRAAAEGAVNVFGETKAIRSQRANMVDTKQQYLLAHLTLLECLLSSPTSLPCTEALPLRIKEMKKQLAFQQQSLQKTTWQDEALRPLASRVTLSERNLRKIRCPELASAKVNRVYLKRYPASDEDSDYISAVYVDGVRLQNQYLATQLPLPGTFADFWRMIAEYKVELIVALQPPDPSDATCCPLVASEEFKPVPYINVRTKEFSKFESYTSQKLTLVDNTEKPVVEQQVTILCSTEWKPGRNEDPPATMSLVTLWQAAERVSRGDGPAVVLCYDGVTGCGLYLALSFLLERMAVERECDVCLAIRAVKRSRSDFVQSLEQMEYLYDAVITYLKYFETYANFT